MSDLLVEQSSSIRALLHAPGNPAALGQAWQGRISALTIATSARLFCYRGLLFVAKCKQKRRPKAPLSRLIEYNDAYAIFAFLRPRIRAKPARPAPKIASVRGSGTG